MQLQLVRAKSRRYLACILAVLIASTLCLQMMVLFYHDDFVKARMSVVERALYSLKPEALENMRVGGRKRIEVAHGAFVYAPHSHQIGMPTNSFYQYSW